MREEVEPDPIGYWIAFGIVVLCAAAVLVLALAGVCHKGS